jgi:hypothetical protein
LFFLWDHLRRAWAKRFPTSMSAAVGESATGFLAIGTRRLRLVVRAIIAEKRETALQAPIQSWSAIARDGRIAALYLFFDKLP